MPLLKRNFSICKGQLRSNKVFGSKAMQGVTYTKPMSGSRGSAQAEYQEGRGFLYDIKFQM